MRKLILLSGFISFVAHGAAAYSVQVIQIPTGLNSVQMSGINNSGQVAAYGQSSATGNDLAFIGSPTGSALLPLPMFWTQAFGLAINNAGQVAGYAVKGFGSGVGNSQAFIGTPSGIVLIPLPAGLSESHALAINDAGQVAGYSFPDPLTSGAEPAFIGSASGSTLLPQLAGWNGSTGRGINNAGQVAGDGGGPFFNQPFIGSAAGVTVIPLPSGWGSASVSAINNAGQIAGSNPAAGSGQAFVGTASGGITPIPRPPGAASASAASQSINDSGVVVGASTAGGWMWDAVNGTRLLNSYVPPGWNITNVISISNSGLMLASGSLNSGATQYVELVPTVNATPTPGTGLLVIVGLAMLSLLRVCSTERTRLSSR